VKALFIFLFALKHFCRSNHKLYRMFCLLSLCYSGDSVISCLEDNVCNFNTSHLNAWDVSTCSNSMCIKNLVTCLKGNVDNFNMSHLNAWDVSACSSSKCIQNPKADFTILF